jgi:hypothetical protein
MNLVWKILDAVLIENDVIKRQLQGELDCLIDR